MASIPKTIVIGIFLHCELHMTYNGEVTYEVVHHEIRDTYIWYTRRNYITRLRKYYNQNIKNREKKKKL